MYTPGMRPILSAVLWIGFLFGCSGQLPESLGPAQEILVLADEADWETLETPVRDVFEKTVRTPQEEKTFWIRYGKLEDAESHKYMRRKNILVAAPISSDHSTARFLKTILSPRVQDAIRSGNSAVSWKENVWAQDQLLMVASGTNLESVVDNLQMQADRLYRSAEEARNKSIAQLIYKYGERKELSDQLARDYGWRIRVPFGFHIVEAYPDSGFVVLAKEQPNRWFFVYWEDGIPPHALTHDWCIQKRNDITRRFFDGDRIAPAEVTVYESEFNGKLAVTLQGLWENEENWTGGPFKSYAFVDVDLNRFFFIDMGVFAPNKYKEPYLRQVDLMAKSFRLAGSAPPP